ncbi:MAG: lactonase family protein [Gemmatimonadetes bacterium]|jgi:6-phosphogluconolactonase|nr:lactonase family protein [Gemmatimonadota bacterium]MBT6147639.1 lactonase family protein [Gemmatimonadota bacterium]MBT7862665.1 lactonase family protein [Gemmatimonadota bacterium]
MSYHVYISNSGSNFLSHLVLNADTGQLDARDNIDLGEAPGAIATDAAGKRMWICLRANKQFASFDIDPVSGSLSATGRVTVPDGSPYIRTDNTDRFLLASYYGAGHVSVHAIAADGTLSVDPLQWIPTDTHAHSIQTDRSNRFAFVPHTNPPNAIYQFCFDATNGALTANEPATIQPSTPEGPRHFVFHPTKDLFYSVNENGSTVSAHHFDPDSGTLSGFQVISTLPEGFDPEENTTAEITISADGQHLYASNRGHDTLALFDVAEDGSLSLKAHYDTEATPRFFYLDPTGKWMLSVGQDSGRMSVYAVDQATGALAPTQRLDVGDAPLWIEFVNAE